MSLALLLAVGLLGGCGRDEGRGDLPAGISGDTVAVGTTSALSGPAASSGTAQVCGMEAYLRGLDDRGGVEMSDGVTRQVELTVYDDAYDPARAVQNYERLVRRDEAFALVGTFGTAPNVAIMERANRDGVPHVFMHSGAGLFSASPEKRPWTVGWLPTYEAEGRTYGEFLAARGEPARVAVLVQNDDLGEAFVRGFEEGIAGSPVEVVARQTAEPSDPTVDSQVTNLAASGADTLLTAVVDRLQARALVKARQLGWDPTLLLASTASSLPEVVEPAGLEGTEQAYTVGTVKSPGDPRWADDEEVARYLELIEAQCPDLDPRISDALWGYAEMASFVQALREMDDLSREGLMAAIDDLDGRVDLLLPGVRVDGSVPGEPVLHGSELQRLEGGVWQPVDERQSPGS